MYFPVVVSSVKKTKAKNEWGGGGKESFQLIYHSLFMRMKFLVCEQEIKLAIKQEQQA